MQRRTKGTPARGAGGSARRAGEAALAEVTVLPSLHPSRRGPMSGSGLEPLPAEDVDVLAVAVAPSPDPEHEEDGDGAAARPVPEPRLGAVEAAVRYGADAAARALAAGMSGRAGELLVIEPPRGREDLPARLFLVGTGDEGPAALRRAGAALARATLGARRIRTTVVDGLEPDRQRAFLEGFQLGGYRVPSAAAAAGPEIAERLEVTGLDPDAATRAHATARAVWLARDLTNTPPNTATPAWLAEQAEAVGRAAGLETEVLGPEELAARGFGGLLAVGSGSVHPPRLARLSYRPQHADGTEPPHLVLVGKGISFDSGGLSLKPRDSMMSMKTDMAGAAVALAVVQATAALRLPVRITSVLALAENLPGADAYRPGDVVRTFDGTTVEIGNTDAEGRIVLADALAWAAQELEPDLLVDIATLTGAAQLGLGNRYGALFGSESHVLDALVEAGERSGEPLWPLPLVPEYAAVLDSAVADTGHVAPPGAKVGGGAIIAALFLQKFTGGAPWAHLDIAGPARAGADHAENPKGATGFGTRVLLSYLETLSGGLLQGQGQGNGAD